MHLNKHFYKKLLEKLFHHPIHHKSLNKADYHKLDKKCAALKEEEHAQHNKSPEVKTHHHLNGSEKHPVVHIFYHNHHLEHEKAPIQYKKLEEHAEQKHHEFLRKGLTCIHYHLHHVFASCASTGEKNAKSNVITHEKHSSTSGDNHAEVGHIHIILIHHHEKGKTINNAEHDKNLAFTKVVDIAMKPKINKDNIASSFTHNTHKHRIN